MRIWIGEEQEGLPKTRTLFIQGEKVNTTKVLRLAVENSIKRLYFGAGKEEVKDFTFLYKIPTDFIVVIETAYPQKLPTIAFKYNIVYRIESISFQDLVPCRTTIKFENKNFIVTGLMSDMHLTMLDKYNPKTKMYNSDKLLYEE